MFEIRWVAAEQQTHPQQSLNMATVVPTTINEGETTPPLSPTAGVYSAVSTQETTGGSADGVVRPSSPIRYW